MAAWRGEAFCLLGTAWGWGWGGHMHLLSRTWQCMAGGRLTELGLPLLWTIGCQPHVESLVCSPPRCQQVPHLHLVVAGQVLVVMDEVEVPLNADQQVPLVIGKGQALGDGVQLQVPAGHTPGAEQGVTPPSPRTGNRGGKVRHPQQHPKTTAANCA